MTAERCIFAKTKRGDAKRVMVHFGSFGVTLSAFIILHVNDNNRACEILFILRALTIKAITAPLSVLYFAAPNCEKGA